MTENRTRFFVAPIAFTLLMCSCSKQPAPPLQSAYPIAVDLDMVGKYPALAKSGGGYVYDDVLEYRVWMNAEGGDYHYGFATYEEAKHFFEKRERATVPLVLVLQREHINEPQPGNYEHIKGNRTAEWRVEWLKDSKRGPDTIASFLREKAQEAAQRSPLPETPKPTP